VGSVAACASETRSGIVASLFVGTAASCGHAPPRIRPTTRVPVGGPLPSPAARSTTPARSHPTTVPFGMSRRCVTSPRLSENARVRTRASTGRGVGSGTSVSAMCGADGVVVRAHERAPESIKPCGERVVRGNFDGQALLSRCVQVVDRSVSRRTDEWSAWPTRPAVEDKGNRMTRSVEGTRENRERAG
jgi:hypothetical protein